MNTTKNNIPVKIFWTGGWDSTFRVLQLALVENKLVDPYYLIDFHRKSYPVELTVIKNLREKINNITNLILPLKIYLKDDIPEYDEISQAYEKTKNICRFGSQNKWMANFCAFKKIYGIEVSSHKHIEPAPYQKIIFNDLNKQDYSLNKESIAYPVVKYFSFPIVNFTKLDMLNYARQHNFESILNETWFCHKPINNKPCGLCHPCTIAIEQNRQIEFARFKNLRRFKNKVLYKLKHAKFINVIL